MCGIAAYRGPENAQQHVIDSLKHLEYRGYDSWGVACINIDKIEIMKQIGQIGQVTLEKKDRQSGLAIGHTRWATHGDVTNENAHPFISFDKKIAIVHNGIIENAEELRKFLSMRGVECKTPVDSEVIPHLISVLMHTTEGFEEATRKCFKMLKGNYAIVALHQDLDTIIAARNGVPLVIGTKEDTKETFLASDPTAFLDKTRRVVFLNDGEYATIKSNINLKNIEDNKKIELNFEDIKWNLEDVTKGKFDHFMIKEIHEQKRVVSKAVAKNKETVKPLSDRIKTADKVIITGCGTSLNAAMICETLLLKEGIDTRTIPSSDFSSIIEILTEKSIVIAVSQSGETADVIEALKLCEEKNIYVAAIVNSETSTLARRAKTVLLMHSGPEISVVATKSFLCTIAIFYSLIGEIKKNTFYPVSLCDRIARIINEFDETAKKLAKELHKEDHIYLIGHDIGKATALESALKIKEISYIHAEGFLAGELKHGVIALISKNTPVIAFSNEEDKILLNCASSEISSRGGKVIAVSTQPLDKAVRHIKILNDDNTGCFEQITFCQLLSYYLALERKCDPDKPRNLAKSVTVK